MILLLLSTILIFIINIFGIELYSEMLNSFIIILLSFVSIYNYVKLSNNIKDAFLSFFVILFFGLFVGFFINELPSFSLGITTFYIGVILSALIYLFIYKKDIFQSKIKSLKFILSYILILIFVTNIIYISPLGIGWFSYKHKQLYNKCINDLCIDLYEMNDTFFFGDNYIQSYKYDINFPFIKYKIDEISYNSTDFNFNYTDLIYELEILSNGKKEHLIIK